MNRNRAEKEMMKHYGIGADEFGDVRLLLYPAGDEPDDHKVMSLLDELNGLAFSELPKADGEDRLDYYRRVLDKRHERDLGIFKDMLKMTDEWAETALWNAVGSLQYDFALLKREEFSDDEWEYLCYYKYIEDEFDLKKGGIPGGEVRSRCFIFRGGSIVNDFNSDVIDRLPALCAERNGAAMEYTAAELRDICYEMLTACFERADHAFAFMAEDRRDGSVLGIFNVSCCEAAESAVINVYPFVSADRLSGAIEDLAELLFKGKLYCYEEDPNKCFVLKRKRIKASIIRMLCPCIDEDLNGAIVAAGFEKRGTVSRYSPFTFCRESSYTDRNYYEKRDGANNENK